MESLAVSRIYFVCTRVDCFKVNTIWCLSLFSHIKVPQGLNSSSLPILHNPLGNLSKNLLQMLHWKEKTLCSFWLYFSMTFPISMWGWHLLWMPKSLLLWQWLRDAISLSYMYPQVLCQHHEILFSQISAYSTATSSHKTIAWTSLAGFQNGHAFFFSNNLVNMPQIKLPKTPK